MHYIQIKKIKEIPFRINPDKDPIVKNHLAESEVPDALAELGFSKKERRELVLDDGTVVYYKNRRNGLYLAFKTE